MYNHYINIHVYPKTGTVGPVLQFKVPFRLLRFRAVQGLGLGTSPVLVSCTSQDANLISTYPEVPCFGRLGSKVSDKIKMPHVIRTTPPS